MCTEKTYRAHLLKQMPNFVIGNIHLGNMDIIYVRTTQVSLYGRCHFMDNNCHNYLIRVLFTTSLTSVLNKLLL